MKIIAYAYEADLHCQECTLQRFGAELNGTATIKDREGNEVHPIFDIDEQLEPLVCGDCHEIID